MPRLTHPRSVPINITHTDDIFIGYNVRLDVNVDGVVSDVVTAYWLVPDVDGTLRKSTIDVTTPAALAAASAVFNASKDEVS